MPRNLRDRGRDVHGHRWCDDNYDIKQEIIEKNGGVMPFTPAFTTSEFEGSDTWTEETPPGILFYLTPPIPKYAAYEPQHVLDENCNPVMSPRKQDQELRSIPTLPDRISLDVPGWLMVAWRRIDPRICLQDIVDRMTDDLGKAQKLTDKTAKIPNKNILQNHCNRNCRKILKYYNAYGRRNEPHKAEIEAIERLRLSNILYNTTLNCHPDFPDRLVKVKFVRKARDGKLYVEELEVTEDNLAETTYPIDHFLFEGYKPVVTKHMERAMSVLFVVQERAVLHGMEAFDWSKLAPSCLPRTWFDRTNRKSVTISTDSTDDTDDIDDGECQTCTLTGSADDNWDQLDLASKPLEPPRVQSQELSIEERIRQSGYAEAEFLQSDEDEFDVYPGSSLGPGSKTTALQKRELLLHDAAMSPTPTERKRKAREFSSTFFEYQTPSKDDVGRSGKKSKVKANKKKEAEDFEQHPFYNPVSHETQATGLSDPFYSPSGVGDAQRDLSQYNSFSNDLQINDAQMQAVPTASTDSADSLEDIERRLRLSLDPYASAYDQEIQRAQSFEQADDFRQAWSSPLAASNNYEEAWSSPQANMQNYSYSFESDGRYNMSQEPNSLDVTAGPMLHWPETANMDLNGTSHSYVPAAGIG